MNRQTIRIRRVGSVTFGAVLLVTGILLLIHTFFPQFDSFMVYRFWPVSLILLGIEVLLGTRPQNYEVLDDNGKVVEQSKTVYDLPAIIMTAVMVGFAIFMAMVYWVYETNGYWNGYHY